MNDLMKIFILPVTLFMGLQTFFHLLSPNFFFFHCSKASRTEWGCRNHCLQSWSTPAWLRSFHYYSLGRGTCAFNDHDIFLVHFGNLKKVHWLFKLSTCKLSFSSSSRNFCHVNLVDFFQDWSQSYSVYLLPSCIPIHYINIYWNVYFVKKLSDSNLL